jgi:hypothetical protein
MRSRPCEIGEGGELEGGAERLPRRISAVYPGEFRWFTPENFADSSTLGRLRLSEA